MTEIELWQVISKGRKEHIFCGVRVSAYASPCVPVDIRVLRSALEAALGTVVEAVPEPDGSFDDGASISCAVRRIGCIEPRS